MKKPCKISASTMARTAALALALTNQVLSAVPASPCCPSRAPSWNSSFPAA